MIRQLTTRVLTTDRDIHRTALGIVFLKGRVGVRERTAHEKNGREPTCKAGQIPWTRRSKGYYEVVDERVREASWPRPSHPTPPNNANDGIRANDRSRKLRRGVDPKERSSSYLVTPVSFFFLFSFQSHAGPRTRDRTRHPTSRKQPHGT